jgi:hypothetical protein
MPPSRFEPTISASERPQTHALDRAPTGIGFLQTFVTHFLCLRPRDSLNPVVPKACEVADPKGSAACSQEMLGYSSVMGTSRFTFFSVIKGVMLHYK